MKQREAMLGALDESRCTAGDERSVDCPHCGAPVGVTCAEHKRATSESSFKVGDRVRITKAWPARAGREGEIVEIDERDEPYPGSTTGVLYVVSGDPKKGEGQSICRRDEIEPILTGLPPEVAVDGLRSEDGLIEYWGKARLQPDGTYQCLANVGGALCRVEVHLRFVPQDQTKLPLRSNEAWLPGLEVKPCMRDIEQEITDKNIRFVQILATIVEISGSDLLPGLLGLDVKGALWQYDHATKTWSPFSTRRRGA